MVIAVTKYAADDGALFDTKDEAEAHNYAAKIDMIARANVSNVENALAGNDDELAAALEDIGTRIARKRLKAGVKKRERRPKDAPAGAST